MTTNTNPKPRVRRWWAVMSDFDGTPACNFTTRKAASEWRGLYDGEYLARVGATPVRVRGRKP